jgi:ubiquinone/menaquinone biosynthesis C-methylase UbiE
MTNAQNFADITELLKELSESKLLIDPLLLGMKRDFFRDEANHIIENGKRKIMNVYYNHEEIKTQVQDIFFGTSLGNDRFVASCIEDFIVCTATYVSHDLYGKIQVDKDVAQMAVNDVANFVDKHGMSSLCQCYVSIVGLENNQALAYYGRFSVDEFVSGVRHRPWTPHALHDELNAGLTLGFYRIVEENGQRLVELTPLGYQRMSDIRRMLHESGYINLRMKAMYIAQFDQSQNWDEIAHAIGPTWRQERKNFLRFLSVQPGMEILEIGCGTGEFTFGSGLYEAVGDTGFVTATDPSVGMIHQAQAKLDRIGAQNVVLEAATAEDIPYDDNEFDAVVGVSFFHFTEWNVAMREMKRVTRDGGMVAMFQPLQLDTYPPVYREWFSDFFELAEKSGVSAPPNYLPRADELKNLFEQHGLHNVEEVILPLPAVWGDPNTVVQFLMNTVGYFQRQMIHLPWEARNDLIERVLAKGEEICRRFSLSERTLPSQAIFIKGVVLKR